MNTVTLDTKGLQAFKRSLGKADKARVQVGIFESHNARDDGETNASIGAKMEFGSMAESTPSDKQAASRGRTGKHRPTWVGNPARSFLDMPVKTELPEVIRAESDSLVSAFVDGGAKPMLEMVGFMAEASIQEAFETGGFGTWDANSDKTKEWKGSDKPLIDSHQLRESISSRVV